MEEDLQYIEIYFQTCVFQAKSNLFTRIKNSQVMGF